MKQYYIFKDWEIIGSTPTKEDAINLIEIHQSKETHFMLRPEFFMVYGEIEYIPYNEKKQKRRAKK